MADALKTLGQSYPQAGVLTTAYTVPAATSALVRSITVCNQSSSPTTYRVSLAVAGAADTPPQYLVYDAPVLGNESQSPPLGIPALAAADVLRVQSANGLVSFNLSGMEVA